MQLSNILYQAALLASAASGVVAHPHHGGNAPVHVIQVRASSSGGSSGSAAPTIDANENISGVNQQATNTAAAPVATQQITAANGQTVAANTTVNQLNVTAPAAVVAATTVNSTILVFARDAASGYSAFAGLNGYAIPYQLVVVPQAGITLPTLNSSTTTGNYGGIVVLSEVSYDYGGTLGFQSALTADQWATLYQYQVTFGARLVRLDVFPGPAFGTSALGGCCATGTEQLLYISDTTAFPTSGMKTGVGAGVSTAGLWHYPATVTNSTIATPFASFGTTTGFTNVSTAGVINKIDGRQQMVFFIGFALDWSATSNYIQHAWITWITRGLYTGYRRVNFGTQIDDMFLISDIYSPAGKTYIITTADLDQHVTWVASVNSRLPAGSTYFPEIGHNGNGNIENSAAVQTATQCGIGPIEYGEQKDTALEFQKPLGTGVNLWPASPATYPYTTTCTNLDKLKAWFTVANNLNTFAHVSHTFTHEDQNNATYYDIFREISWNQAWLKQVGIAGASKFSPKGLIPPAITGLHNGDALKAWVDNGIVNAVGDNTRPILMNPTNEHWPLISTVTGNGFAGVQITPRWATNIYYNCDLPACTVAEWINTSAGAGDWTTLLGVEKNTNIRHLMGLRHDPFMFHQANLNYVTAGTTTINGVSTKYSMLQAWVETMIQEMIRLTSWPLVSLKHDDIATSFLNRMTRDGCQPQLSFTTNPSASTITGVTVTSKGNTCSAVIPVTVPGTVTNTQGFTTEKLGSDPLTIWVKLAGSPVTFTLTTPVPF